MDRIQPIRRDERVLFVSPVRRRVPDRREDERPRDDHPPREDRDDPPPDDHPHIDVRA